MSEKESIMLGNKVLFILMPTGFQETEFNVPFKALIDEGYQVDVAGLAQGPATGHADKQFTPNVQLTDLTTADFNRYKALIIPGGPGSSEHLWDNPLVQKTIKYFHDNKKLVAAICHACVALAQTGILTGKKATVYPSDQAKQEFKLHGVHFVDEGCYIDKNESIITAQSPKFAKLFADAIIALLQ